VGSDYNPLLCFHNLKYDSALFDYDVVSNLDFCLKTKSMYQVKFDFMYREKKYSFKIMDTLKHLSVPLRRFNKDYKLNLSDEKEVMPYKLYTKQRICDSFEIKYATAWVPIEEAIENLDNEDDVNQFRNNIAKWKLNPSEKMAKNEKFIGMYG